ncbi:MAG: tRNA (adenosine(37)-N6)-threonylcarbamoyltransferase complex ATPase subunit type 1 TsaE [Pseudomonadota bacterium]|nr:MAG: tRNA (adenosine(37)-N6)-threonylcarbamoyltransferase complex ATPase subunit type 1 TsaE [Pseudomonadota bacterium]
MEALGERLAGVLGEVRLVYLRGVLGSGKTTLVRGMLRGLGYRGTVRSPTFTLLESYTLARPLHHFDLYRLKDPEELEFLGIRDYLQNDMLCVIEWPERGAPLLPTPDLDVMIAIADMGRQVQLTALGPRAEQIVIALRC